MQKPTTSVRQRFPMSAALVLVVGLIAIAALISFSFVHIFYPTTSINNTGQAKELVDQYLSKLSPDFRVKEIMEFSNHFYIVVQEKSTGINAFELLLDRNTGTILYEPGPNMMWNTKYGHMGQMRETAASMSINAREASEYAQRCLDRNVPSANVEEPETFYGYYTIDLSKNGQILGMLSVNGYTGEVWYHTWHGQFIEMIEYE